MPRRVLSQFEIDAFKQRTEILIARKLLPLIRSATPSQTLRAALKINVTHPGIISIGVPHYWAPFYHDDRAAITMPGRFPTGRPARFLVWFKNPKDDPRIKGGYPVERSQVQHLTRDQFKKGLILNEIGRRVGAGPMAYMVIARRVGPRKGTFFITKGTRNAPEIARPVVASEFDQFIRSVVKTERVTATARI